MHCIFCQMPDTKVIDSRHVVEINVVRRRRECSACGARFNTFESAEMELPRVVKRDGTGQQFDKGKLQNGIRRALEKRPVDTATIDRLVNGVLYRIQTEGEREIQSQWIGELVMDALKQVDHVAYIRFASVYRSFEDVQEFCQTVEQLSKE